ncbi:MAG: M20/M25/M40 family metallo-hydrolase [Planctomycetota bacterium]|nr:M20/M25/M40 family metallo-hydrolase [Planctomycetota bacterium]
MRKVSLLLLLFLSVTFLPAQQLEESAKGITKEQLQQWVERLASPEFEGRKTGTEGIEKAAKMIEETFEKSNLRKFGTLNGYRQTLTMVRYELDGLPTFSADGVAFKHDEDFTVMDFSGEGNLDEIPLLFCGYGITEPKLPYDDYANLDVEGKAVLLLRGAPRFEQKDTPFKGEYYRHAHFRDKVKNAMNHNAAAILIASGTEKDDKNTRNALSVAAFAVKEESKRIPVIIITPKVALQLLGTDLSKLKSQIDDSLKPHSFLVEGRKISLKVKLKKSNASTSNICGYIEGSDEYLKERFIVVGAHYDHLGKRGNLFFPGADDNASGTATVLALAKTFSTLNTPPKRSIIFIAFTGEEIGFVGSSHFVDNPPVPLNSLDVMINIDMVGQVPPGPTASFAGGSASPLLERLSKEAAKKCGVTVKTSPDAGYGSDHFSFLNKSIPSIFVIASRGADLHKPSDTPDKIPYERMCSVVRSVFYLAYYLADYDGVIRDRIGGLPTLGLFLEETDGGLQVVRVLAESPASTAGIKKDDIIFELDGKPVKTEKEFETALTEVSQKKKIYLKLRRDSTELSLEVSLPLPPKPRFR